MKSGKQSVERGTNNGQKEAAIFVYYFFELFEFRKNAGFSGPLELSSLFDTL